MFEIYKERCQMMRVITGSARGRKLATLEGADITRPTSESVKEAVFSMIQFELEDKNVLDLFAGSGQMGIEAISRGAKHCTFIETDRNAKTIIEQNVKNCKFENESTVILADAVSFLSRNNKFDIVFVDPPYKNGLAQKTLEKISNVLTENALVICETDFSESLPNDLSDLKIIKEKKYGKTKITVYRKES